VLAILTVWWYNIKSFLHWGYDMKKVGCKVEIIKNREKIEPLTFLEAKDLAIVDHLRDLTKMYNGLITEYGEEEGKQIFSSLMTNSEEYWLLLSKYSIVKDGMNIQKRNESVYNQKMEVLRNVYDGLISEYGELEGHAIFSLLVEDSVEYIKMLTNSTTEKEKVLVK